MSEDLAKGSVVRAVRLIILLIVGIVVGNVLVTLLIDRDPALGMDELIAFVGGAGLGLLVEFGIFRRIGR
ncbi:hypothetical protein AB0I81_09570 [Nonomuraea sp. NPDC050404]|uniref:hypothetical protein n=1 Tax=Nonomuraea sp. NPDC050404 TaxID=3155783 RepID=UPI0033E1F0CE